MPLTETKQPRYSFFAAWAVLHLAFVWGLAALLRYALEGQTLGQAQLLHWDASWQDQLRQQGYVFQANSQSNLAFFPLFPQVWSWLGLSPMGISLANALLYALSLAALAWHWGFRHRTFALALGAPCLLFFCLPYSESLFFAFAVLALWGLDKEKPWTLALGFFGLALTRSAASLFLPCWLAWWILYRQQQAWRSGAVWGFLGTGLGLLSVRYWQYLQTGLWDGYEQSQAHWAHGLGWPQLPFSSWGSSEISRLDGAAFLLCLSAAVLLLRWWWSKQAPKPVVGFAMLYFAAVGSSLLVFQAHSGSLHSLGRYVFATAFFPLFLWHFERRSFTWPQLRGLGLVLLLYWGLLFGGYRKISTFLDFQLFGLLLWAYAWLNSLPRAWQSRLWRLLYALGMVGQVYFLLRFWRGGWVG